jgi:hypothetical protein
MYSATSDNNQQYAAANEMMRRTLEKAMGIPVIQKGE